MPRGHRYRSLSSLFQVYEPVPVILVSACRDFTLCKTAPPPHGKSSLGGYVGFPSLFEILTCRKNDEKIRTTFGGMENLHYLCPRKVKLSERI